MIDSELISALGTLALMLVAISAISVADALQDIARELRKARQERERSK